MENRNTYLRIYGLAGLATILIVFSTAFTHEITVDIDIAFQQRQIGLSLTSNPAGTHYNEPILATITNKTDKQLVVKIPAGYTFQPQDSSLQKQMNLKTELVSLNANETRTVAIKSNCIQAENDCGNTQYSLSGMANAALLQLVQFIEKKKFWNLSAQNAIWSISDGYYLEGICSYDTLCDMALQQEVAKILGKKVPKRPSEMDYRNNYYAAPASMKSKIGGAYSINLHKPHEVILGMYNTRGIIVREMFNQKEVPPGPHEIKFEFDGAEYTDHSYVFKLTVDGKVMLEDEMEFTVVDE